MLAAQDRAMRHLRLAAERQAGGTIVMVTHCDIIRAIVSGVLGMSLDLMLRFNVDTASVTRVCVGPWGAQLLSLNEQPFSETP